MADLPDGRYILFRREWDAVRQKWSKVPCDYTGKNIDAHKSEHWMSKANAERYPTWNDEDPSKPYGLAWVLNGDGWFFIDMDNCHVNGDWTTDASALFQSFGGCLGEVSTSGTGLHIFGRCDPDQLKDRKNKWDGDKEFYTHGRFVALSKDGPQPIGETFTDLDWTQQLLRVVPEREFLGELPDGVDPAYTGPDDDDELLKMAMRSGGAAAAFGDGVHFADLWEARIEPLSRKYPAYDAGGDFDHSSADAALMTHLAFWTGKDMPRMDRLFRRSALMRDKYAKRADYRRDTIQKSARLCNKVYDRAPRNTSNLTGCHADMSHDDLARSIFAQSWEGNMLYIPELDRWVCWTGKLWCLAKHDKEQITRLRQDLREIPGADDAVRRKRLGDNKTIMAVNALMKTNEGATKPLADWDVDPLILGTPTQIVDLRTGEVRPRCATDFLLRSTSFDPAPAGKIPLLWQTFLETITGGGCIFARILATLERLCRDGLHKRT